MPGKTMFNLSFLTEAQTTRAGLLWSIAGLNKIAGYGLDLIFPPRCANCARVDTSWCDGCRTDLEAVPMMLHQRDVHALDGAAATGAHEGVLQTAVQALKYEGVRALAGPLAARLSRGFLAMGWAVDMAIPVPLHLTRLSERGYNQARLLAEKLAQSHALAHAPDALTRTRNTISQVGLNRQERLENMVDAFEANTQIVAGCSILLVDDVLTTGATLTGCAQAARRAGAAAVYGLTLTMASPDS